MGNVSLNFKDAPIDGPYPVNLGTDTVDTDELVDDSVTTGKILDGEIVNADIGSAAGITEGKLAIANTKFLIGSAGGVGAAFPLSQDVTATAGGAVTIAADAVDTGKIADGAVTKDKQPFPKYNITTETCPVASFVDGGGTTGELVLATTIPAGSVFLYSIVNNIVGFAGDTTATFTIGDGSDVDRYNTGTPDCFTTAADGVDVGAPSGTVWHTADIATVTVTITGASDFGLIAAEGNGTMDVTLAWIDPQGVVV